MIRYFDFVLENLLGNAIPGLGSLPGLSIPYS